MAMSFSEYTTSQVKFTDTQGDSFGGIATKVERIIWVQSNATGGGGNCVVTDGTNEIFKEEALSTAFSTKSWDYDRKWFPNLVVTSLSQGYVAIITG